MNYTARNIRQLVDTYFSLQWCRENIVVPIGVETNNASNSQKLTIAIGNFSYLGTIGDFIKRRVSSAGLECQFIEKPPEEIQSLLDEASQQRLNSDSNLSEFEFSDSDDTFLDELAGAEESNNEFDFEDEEELDFNEDALDLSIEMLGTKVQQAAAKILIRSARSGVSDIHIEPKQDEYVVRVRRDGVMHHFANIPRMSGIKLNACLKNMAKMDVAEKRSSQDGKIRRRFEGKTLEFRCATAPAKYGEKIVMRILNSDTDMLDLDTLIVNEEVRKEFRMIIDQSDGIIIVSGPTGSGKSTTLASALREKDSGELNIMTAEDPIEYELGGTITQFQVIREKEQTFGNLLRTFLRQDPDVILIGETRDRETAISSMEAAETGHLVFTTLHANSASSSLTRLIDMEIPSYKLTSALRGVLAQRLMRKVCPSCSTQRTINDVESDFTGLPLGTKVRFANVLNAEEKQKRKQEETLCTRCNGTGYKGRIGTYELMKVSSKVCDAIKHQKTTREIESVAVDDGMLTLKTYAVDLIAKQLTTISELRKICNTNH